MINRTRRLESTYTTLLALESFTGSLRLCASSFGAFKLSRKYTWTLYKEGIGQDLEKCAIGVMSAMNPNWRSACQRRTDVDQQTEDFS